MNIDKVRPSKSLAVRRLRRLAKAYADAWAELRYTMPGEAYNPNIKRTTAMREYERARERFYRELDRVIAEVETGS